MRGKIVNWTIVILLLSMISLVPLVGVSASTEGKIAIIAHLNLEGGTDTGPDPENTYHLIIGAFVIVLVIIGIVYFRRPKS